MRRRRKRRRRKRHINEEFSNSNINQFAAVKFLHLVVNSYVGRETQERKGLFWDKFLKHLKNLLDGERTVVVNLLSF